jgi:hypothetical protein
MVNTVHLPNSGVKKNVRVLFGMARTSREAAIFSDVRHSKIISADIGNPRRHVAYDARDAAARINLTSAIQGREHSLRAA